MMAWTDHHFRTLLRLLTRQTLLYTEMIPADAVLEAAAHSPARLAQLVAFDGAQKPLAVQLGGRDPAKMAAAAALCAAFGYDEVNLNVGCPSETVSGLGACGASLMREPAHVAVLVAKVRAAVPPIVRVSVKHRLGVDECNTWSDLVRFAETLSAPPAGLRFFVVHARAAILGLSTADNRAVPPLRPDWVFCLAARFPQLSFALNGGIATLAQARRHLAATLPASPNAAPAATYLPRRQRRRGETSNRRRRR